MESNWEACRSIFWKRSDLKTVRTGQNRLPPPYLDHLSFEALPAVDMVALELLGVCVGLQAKRTIELVL